MKHSQTEIELDTLIVVFIQILAKGNISLTSILLYGNGIVIPNCPNIVRIKNN